jgi:hypothetical protein
MRSDRVIRNALRASVLLNLIGLVVFAPLVVGRASPFVPVPVTRFFAAQVAFTIALFGAVYAWQSVQQPLNRALIAVGGIGKLGFFALTLVYAIIGDVPAQMVMSALPDLAFAGIFLWWAWSQ